MAKEKARRQRRQPGATGAAYRSGAAARLAGIPVETLRVWERRHGVAGPSAAPGGQRRYTAEQVRRLRAIKQLVDLGNPISALAKLPDEALAEMHAAARALAPGALHGKPSASRPPRAALVGEAFVSRLKTDIGRETGLDITATCADLARAPAALEETRAEVIVVDVPALLEGSLAAIDGARKAVAAAAGVVLYQFGQRDAVRTLRGKGYVVARSPLDAGEIEPLCRAALAAKEPVRAHSAASRPSPELREPRFDEEALAQLARASSTVFCECPRHLAELLRMLGSFERYSALCENRSPEDAALHRDLKGAAGKARALLEDALVRVALSEGLSLPRGRNEGVG